MNPEIRQYVETEIIPRYAYFDKAHSIEHVRAVIERAMALTKFYDVSDDMVYVAAAYHDTGLVEGRDFHHTASARIIREESALRQWFKPEEIETIAQAAEDHRASAANEPRSIYGKIIAEADRHIEPETVIRRCIQYGLAHEPEKNRREQFQRALCHLRDKYGDNGYLKLWIPESPNAEKLQLLRTYIKDERKLQDIFDRIYRHELLEPLANERFVRDERHRTGHIRIINCPAGTDIIGLYTPEQKLLAKELAQRADWREIIDDLNTAYQSGRTLSYEGKMIWAFAINYVKCDIDERLSLLDDFIRAVDCWSACDQFVCSAKWVKKFKQQTWEYIKRLSTTTEAGLRKSAKGIHSGSREFYVRMAVIMALDYYLADEKDLEHTFEMISGIGLRENEPYYIKMGVAWCLATALAKHSYETREYIATANLPEDIKQLYVRKARESRITKYTSPF